MAIQYNKKVMQHFLKPKNVGKMKNADGIGQVGNPVCLTPEEKIHSNLDLVQISDLKKENNIINHFGKQDYINSIISRRYDGHILEIKNKLGRVRLTPEHLVFALSLPKEDKFLRTKWKKTLVPSWHHSENLKRGDITLYPIIRKIKDIKFININIKKPKWDFRSKEIPKRIPINGDFLRLVGYYLSEGHASLNITRVFLTFSFHIDQKKYAKDIKKIVKKLFNLNVKVREISDKKTLVVELYSAILTRFFKELFGKGAENKKLPGFMLFLPLEKQKELIKGLWRGDGYVNLERNGARAGYSTISYNLTQQIKMLLLRQEIAPSIYVEKEKIIRGVKHKKNYRIHVGQRDSLIKLCSMLGISYKPKCYASVDSWFSRDYFFTPITEIKKENYKGFVHNLEIKNSHSFISEAFSLHNCGDIMKVYIKVGKNKKGEEIIKDIKFETLGCAAAIATSSMVTELAKGKTLKQAMKITRDSVSDALGNLPPIKEHCSNLAANALHEAIKDYLNKKTKLK
jgi:nitrogen fixation protein NifU and related proteins